MINNVSSLLKNFHPGEGYLKMHLEINPVTRCLCRFTLRSPLYSKPIVHKSKCSCCFFPSDPHQKNIGRWKMGSVQLWENSEVRSGFSQSNLGFSQHNTSAASSTSPWRCLCRSAQLCKANLGRKPNPYSQTGSHWKARGADFLHFRLSCNEKSLQALSSVLVFSLM